MIRFVLFFFFITFIFSCKTKTNNETYQPPKPSNLTGKELAQTYCASCHQFPEPNFLDKKTWQTGILPKMYARLGLEEDNFALFSSMNMDEMQVIINAGIYPDRPTMAKQDWAKIVKYYIENAPETPLTQEKKSKVSVGLKGFETLKLYSKQDKKSSVTMVKFNSIEKNIFIGYRGQTNSLKKYDLNLLEIDSSKIESPISDITSVGNQKLLLLMGLMDPNDQKKGSLVNFIDKTKILDSLQRPVNIEISDLNADGTSDYVICNFGNELGKLVWFDGKTKKENVLNNNPGARKTVIKDLNGDNKPDIMVLMTQAKEQIILYVNKGGGIFEEQIKLNFPPVYGSSYFELIDFNKDGFQDILYTNGDNADLSISLKKYHGVRIFQNDGKNNFKQTYFYPMYGASKAMAADFDLDGDLDIAAISFFTNPKQTPNEGFLIFSNSGDNSNFNVSTSTFSKTGNWMVMDVADMDNDGDSDILFGAFSKKGLSSNSTNLKNNRNLEVVLLKNTRNN
jgi:FG-GAP-like repeat